MRIDLVNFKGESPRTPDRLLPDNYAQTAQNVDLNRGTLKPIKDLKEDRKSVV